MHRNKSPIQSPVKLVTKIGGINNRSARFALLVLLISMLGFSTMVMAGEKFLVQAENYRVVNVKADDSLNVRAEPDLKAKVLGALPPNTRITATGRGFKETSGRSWLEVYLPGQTTGWVNKFYMRRLALEQPAANSKTANLPKVSPPATQPNQAKAPQAASTPSAIEPVAPSTKPALIRFPQTLQCNGTEPFWKLEFRGEKVRYTQVDTTLYVWPQFIYKQSANSTAVWWLEAPATDTSPRLLAVIDKSGTCSDGMNDKNYPYRLTGRVGGLVYSGCCSSK